MSANATRTLWLVQVEAGRMADRTGEWMFTNERAAKSFAKVVEEWIDDPVDVSITEVEAYLYATAALWQGWPFEELRMAARERTKS
jgi:hypothetical protein